MTKKTLRAAIYVRQSVREDQGIAQQIAECKRRAKGEGWSVVDIYNDNATSATKERGEGTDWARMLADIDAGKVDMIVSVTAARLLRRMVDVYEITKPVRDVRIVTLRDGIDTATLGGRLMLTMLVLFAEAEVEEKEARAIPYRAARREAGHPAPGLVPYGYRWIPKLERDEKGTRYAVVPAEADVLRYMSKELLGGAKLGEIVRVLNDDGKRTRKGARWSASTVRRLLISPFQAGMLPPPMAEGARYDPSSFTWSECVPGAWEPILSEDAVIVARGMLLDDSRRKHDGDTKAKHLLSGVGRCGKCHGPLRSAMTKTKDPARGYRCTKGCFQRPASIIEACIADAVIRVLGAPGLLKWVDDDMQDIDALRAHGAALAARRAEAEGLYRTGRLSGGTFSAMVDEIDADAERVDHELAEAVRVNPLAEFVSVDDVRGLWDGLSTGRRRAILSALVFSVDVLPVGKGVRVRTLEEAVGTIVMNWRRAEHRASWDTGEITHVGKVPEAAQTAISAAIN
ncbi:recombinase family protein [Microbacterium sp. YMB-B2]|uniref:Recombinase family protein n=1 Tax=Microbacterium tenebrionis TaxID=2830665 RepID=A0A9X1S096_9MICO|nr:recombinase family protein [Microbacterium tenebrionis]MCC2030341.1 recombinase family protein [Microbacterium tenebrionis]